MGEQKSGQEMRVATERNQQQEREREREIVDMERNRCRSSGHTDPSISNGQESLSTQQTEQAVKHQ